MIVRAHRFHGFNSLKPVYARGQTARGSLITTKYILNPRRDSYRLAVVVSRKVHKSAVVRNRIRRRIYENVRKRQAAITEPYDIVITVFSEQIATMSAADLEAMVYGQLLKAHVVRQKPRSDTRGGRDIVVR